MKIKLTLPILLSIVFALVLFILAWLGKLWQKETLFFIVYSFTGLMLYRYVICWQSKQTRLIKFNSIYLIALILLSLNNIFFPVIYDLSIFAASYVGFTVLLAIGIKQQRCAYLKEQNNERKKAEQRIEALTYTQLQLEAILTENQDELESKVQERTIELNIALQELEEANRILAEKNTVDDLTGLYNRRYYDQKVLAEFRRSRRNLSTLSLVVLDIDHFKKVNDRYGHLAGDYCLQEVAKIIKKSSQRSADIACRYGGEEFCLLLPETDLEGANSIAQELRKTIENAVIKYKEQPIPLTISCGIACYQQQVDATPETIFALADKALYQAKQDGRNCVVLAENAAPSSDF